MVLRAVARSANCRTGSINRSKARHADLALAILSAFVEAQRVSAPSSRTSVPAVTRDANPLYEPVCSENFA